MIAFFLKRLAGGALTLFVIATLCFFIIRFAPGNPFTGENEMASGYGGGISMGDRAALSNAPSVPAFLPNVPL